MNTIWISAPLFLLRLLQTDFLSPASHVVFGVGCRQPVGVFTVDHKKRLAVKDLSELKVNQWVQYTGIMSYIKGDGKAGIHISPHCRD